MAKHSKDKVSFRLCRWVVFVGLDFRHWRISKNDGHNGSQPICWPSSLVPAVPKVNLTARCINLIAPYWNLTRFKVYYTFAGGLDKIFFKMWFFFCLPASLGILGNHTFVISMCSCSLLFSSLKWSQNNVFTTRLWSSQELHSASFVHLCHVTRLQGRLLQFLTCTLRHASPSSVYLVLLCVTEFCFCWLSSDTYSHYLPFFLHWIPALDQIYFASRNLLSHMCVHSTRHIVSL